MMSDTSHVKGLFCLRLVAEAAVIGLSTSNRLTFDPREPIKAPSSFEAAVNGIWALNRSTLDRFEHRSVTLGKLLSPVFGP